MFSSPLFSRSNLNLLGPGAIPGLPNIRKKRIMTTDGAGCWKKTRKDMMLQVLSRRMNQEGTGNDLSKFNHFQKMFFDFIGCKTIPEEELEKRFKLLLTYIAQLGLAARMDAAKIQTANREIETLNERRASVQNIVASFRVMTAEDRRIATLQARVDQLPSRQHLQTKAWVLKNQLDRLREDRTRWNKLTELAEDDLAFFIGGKFRVDDRALNLDWRKIDESLPHSGEKEKDISLDILKTKMALRECEKGRTPNTE